VGLISYIIKIKLSRNSGKGDAMEPEIQKFILMLGSPACCTTNFKNVVKAKIHITGPTKGNVLGTKSYRTAKAVPKKDEIRGDVTPVTVT